MQERREGVSECMVLFLLSANLFIGDCRIIRPCDACQEQEDWRVLRDEETQEGRHHQAETGRSRYLREHHPRRH